MTDRDNTENGQTEPNGSQANPVYHGAKETVQELKALHTSEAERDHALDPRRTVVLERQGDMFVLRRMKESPLHAARLRFPVETEARSAVLAARRKAETQGAGATVVSPTTEALLRLMAQCEAIITKQIGVSTDLVAPFEMHDAIKLQNECNETLAQMIADIRLTHGVTMSRSEPLA